MLVGTLYMIIGIIGAMEQEVALLRKRLNHFVLYQRAGCNIYIGQLHGIKIALLKSGIGKVAAALGTTLLLDHFKPNLVINIGSSGSLVPSLKIGDIVVSNEVRYHDVDITAFGYKIGQIAKCPVSFSAAPSLVMLAEKIINYFGIRAIRGLIVSGDTFVNNLERLSYIRQTFPQAITVDMEATSIAHICYQFTVPFVIIRAISDIAGQESHLSFKEFLTVAAQHSACFVEEMVRIISEQY